jgi:hypothetical protein
MKTNETLETFCSGILLSSCEFSTMTKTFFPDSAPLMSPRTAKYIEAMIREGDRFDYDNWLQKVRQEEAAAKQAEATGTSGELAAAKINRPISTHQIARANLAWRLMTKTMRVPIVLPRPHRQAKSPTPKDRLRRWLEKVRVAWGEFQASRTRDAVYGFLEEVFTVVEHYRVRRRTTRLLRHTFEFANLPFDKDANPFSAVIRCTCSHTTDNKMISKWSRALRYASRRKDPDMRLKTFMKEAGGVNTCANLYAKHFGRGRRK